MARLRTGQLALAFGAALLLAGCVEGTSPAGGVGAAGTEAASRTARAGKAVERDVERPDIFKASDKGLWDGRPSLGGVWVAHPAVQDPERVLIRNTATGATVEGALFRRERDMPGPLLQVSSDAAEALGLLAGQPADLTVVALRREVVTPEPAPVEAEPADAPAAPAPAPEASDTRPEARPAPVAAAAAAGAAAAGTAVDAGAAAAGTAADTAAEPPAPVQKRKWWQKKPKPAAEEPAAAASDVAPVTTVTIDSAPLDAPAAAAEEPAPSVGTVASGGNLSLPYIQIGTFSAEANANEAAAALGKAGLTAAVKKTGAGGKTVWRVIAGPAATVAERNAILKTVTGLGYKDAYPVAG